MSTLVLSSAIWFGYEFTTFIIRNRLEYLVRISVGTCFGISFQAFIFFITSLYFPLCRKHAIIVSCIFSLVSGIVAYLNSHFKPSRRIKYSILDITVLSISALFIGFGVYCANIEKGTYTRGPAYADLPFHMNIISSFAYGINFKRRSLFDVWSSFQADIMLAYPMFHNFYIAVLIDCDDISYSFALQITAIILSLSFLVLLYEFFYVFSRSDRIISIVSIVTWTLLGGLGYTMVFYPQFYNQRANNWILRFSEIHHATWMQPLVHILIPQRSALFSAPLCLSCLLCFLKGVKKWEISYFILAGFCTSLLPQIQIHSFVAIAQFAVMTCLIFFPSKEKFWHVFNTWLTYALISCVIGLPLTLPYWIRKSENRTTFIRFEPFWNDNIYGKMRFPLVTVWWKALGPFGMVMILFGWVSASGFQMKFWATSMSVWLITMFVMYQPWKMDNLKLLFSVWLPIAVPYVTQFYVYVWRNSKSKWIKVFVIILVLQNTFSSILSFNTELFKKLIFIQEADYHCGHWINENTPIDSIFLSYSSRFNPATAIAGRQLFLGFISWTAQHGVLGPNRELKVSQLLQDNGNADLFASEAVGYVLLKWNTSLVFPLKAGNKAWFKVYDEFPYTLYKLNHSNIALPEHLREKEERKEKKEDGGKQATTTVEKKIKADISKRKKRKNIYIHS